MAGYGTDTGTAGVSATGKSYRAKGRSVGGKRPNEKQSIKLNQVVGSSLVEVFTASTTKAKGALPVAETLQVKNAGDSALGAVVKISNWSDATTQSGDIKLNFVIPKGETLRFPSARVVSTDEATFLSGTSVTNTAPDSNMYVDSTADADSATAAGVVGHATNTRVYLEPYTSAANCTANLFRVGDLIRIRDEVMEVTAIGDKSDLANNYLDVIRGVKGSSSGTAAVDDDPVRLTFFNAFHNYNKFSTARTDKDGKFSAGNFFGYGRSLVYQTEGIQAGSVAIKCYERAYQELGMSGVNATTRSGLAASTEYKFNITIDGGSTFSNLAFTTDATNLNFGGRNGVVPKIQAALNEQYYTAGNLFEKQVFVDIINGDIRFTSASRLSTSAVLLAAPTSGTTPFGVGRIPAIGNIETAVASRLPSDTKASSLTGTDVGNTDAFMYDDGRGNLIGKGNGTINYDTGEISFVTYPDSEFVVSAIYGSAMSGKLNSDVKNVIEEIKVQSMNSKVEGKVEIDVDVDFGNLKG
tara:strand:+ start:2339 stop:3913 length:1575 start_codon:yes stop_codon:yes gene_type:complete